MVQVGSVTASTWVWRPGRREWAPAGEFAELGAWLGGASPTAPAPKPRRAWRRLAVGPGLAVGALMVATAALAGYVLTPRDIPPPAAAPPPLATAPPTAPSAVQLATRIDALRRHLDRLQTRVDDLGRARKEAWRDVADRLQADIVVVEQGLRRAGLRLEALLETEAPTGGPIVVMPPEGGPLDRLDAAIDRAAALEVAGERLPLEAPLEEGYRITSGFGARRDPIEGDWAMHRALDFGAAAGTEVRAPAPGRVLRAGPAGSYGNLVELDHGRGVRSRYAHLLEVRARAGTRVARGDLLGLVGSTGRSTGNHLHYEVLVDGRKIDPLLLVQFGEPGDR